MPPGTVIGHVHLHVGDLRDRRPTSLAKRSVLTPPSGTILARCSSRRGATIITSAANIWAGPDAQPPTEEDAQLLEWTIELPEPTSLGPLADSLARAGRPVEPIDGAGTEPTLVTQDPWGTRLRVVASQAGLRGAQQ